MKVRGHGHGLGRTAIAVAVSACFLVDAALANPTAPKVVSGTATFQQAGNTLQITNSPNAIINWQSFSIGANEITRFIQQSQASAVLNRVTGAAGVVDPSVILGVLQSNGRVFLINPSGILFGAGAQVDVAGLVASSLNLSNADFLGGRIKFTEVPGAGSVVNQGNITTGAGGSVYLIGPAVTNGGIITTPKGEVILAAGNSVELVNPGTPDLRVEITAPDNQAVNLGRIVADSGRVGIYAGLIKQGGTIRADSAVATEDGRILLKATQKVTLEAGSVTSASGPKGGSIELAAPQVRNDGEVRADGAGGRVTVSAVADAASAGATGFANTGTVSADTVEVRAQGQAYAFGVANDGQILARERVSLSALDNAVVNPGTIATSAGGRVELSGDLITIGGSVRAPGGLITATARSMYQSGSMDVSRADGRGGDIRINTGLAYDATFESTLLADGLEGGTIYLNGGEYGRVMTSGTLSARGSAGGGGEVYISAREATLTGTVEASGKTRGGRILFGGGKSGDGEDAPMPTQAIVNSGARLRARGEAGGSIDMQADVLINTGSIDADGAQGGSVKIEARNVLSAGRISADGSQGMGGEVNVQASNRVIQTSAAHLSADGVGGGGKVTLRAADRVFGSGTLTAIGHGAGSTGGEIEVLGNEIVLLGANLDASGDAGGGTVLVGGDFQGSNPAVQNARGNQINFSTTVNADARTTGSGGKVIVWSDRETQFYGSISARGGALSGDGGFIEVSGKENLVFGGTADAGAPNGTPGTLLLDPKFIVIDAAGGGLGSFLLADPNPGAGHQFAQQVVVLPNDNMVATDPNDDFVASNAGAVYLYNGSTGALISTLTGSTASDAVGSGGVTVLTNGNFVVRSQNWDNSAVSAGAVTWGSSTTGVNGAVSATNSLVGSTASDQIGSGGITALTNGNYVVSSPLWDNLTTVDAGAVTWGNGATGRVGVVGTANSLVGTLSSDQVGSGSFATPGVIALVNGNYVVSSPNWDNSTAVGAGAVTWGNGTSGTVGTVSAANSLVGSTSGDNVGGGGGATPGVVALTTNGNYVVMSYLWDNITTANAGAVTLGNGSGGTVGTITASNSLVGSNIDDLVGNGGVTPLNMGNFVVASVSWNGSRGAATWGSGTAGFIGGNGAVSQTNSLVGSQANDRVGASGVTALTNGNYVVSSQYWANTTTSEVGAVTWGNGATGNTGTVTTSNSLVGSTAFDAVGSGGVTALTANGNYVVSSPYWANLTNGAAGAVTWVRGTDGFPSGATSSGAAVSTANSLVGSTASDFVGNGGVTALTNGNYVVKSTNWSVGATTQAGAVTWGNGTAGVTGSVTIVNSLVGSTSFDNVGSGGVIALTNGNYVVSSPVWDDSTTGNVGAVTWGNGTIGITGSVTAINSLVGSTAGDQVGFSGVTALTNGNYVVRSPKWNGNVGAATFGNGSTGVAGTVSASNSLVGTVAFDLVTDTCGEGCFDVIVTPFSNGHYAVVSSGWNNGTTVDVGAVTFGSGTTGVSGTVSSANSLIGAVASDFLGSGGVSGMSNGNFVVRSPSADNATFVDAGLVHVVGVQNPLAFANNAAGTATITPLEITRITNTGTAVTLQANTDITLNAASDIVTNNTGGDGGAITMQAGRSVILNSNITTDNGNLTITANDPAAQAANRDAGAGGITMAAGTTLNAGTGMVTLTVGSGVPGAASGNLVVENITAANVNLQQNGRTSGSSILRASASSLISATNLLLEVDLDDLVSGGSIGTAAEPMRVAVSNLESHTHEASPGIFIDSPTQGLTIGGVPFFGGAVKGVQNVTSGDISITANGTLTQQAGTAGCGATGGTGGPICTGGSTITLSANNMSIGNSINAGAGLVRLAPFATNRDIAIIGDNVEVIGDPGLVLSPTQIQQVTAGTLEIGRSTDTGTLTISTALGSSNINAGTLKLAHQSIALNQPITFSTDSENLVLTSGTASTIAASISTGSGTINAADGSGVVNFSGSPVITSTFAGTGFSAGTLNVDSTDNVTLNATTITANLNLSGGTLQGAGNLTVSGVMNWTGGTMSGSGSTNLASGSVSTFNTTAGMSSSRAINNAGTVTVIGNGNLQLNVASGVLTNQSGGVFDIQGDGTIGDFDGTGNGSGSLTNAGLLTRTTSAGTATLSTLTVNNNSGATLQVDSGTLTVNAGTFNQNGTVTLAGGTVFNLASGGSGGGGTYSLGAGAQVNFSSGTQTFNTGADISGAGLFNVNGGVMTVDATTMSVDNLQLTSSGTLNGTGALTVDNSLTWSGGTMSGAGSTNLPAGSVATFDTSAGLSSTRAITNAGTVTVIGNGNLQLNVSAGVLTNQSTGVLDIQGNSTIGDFDGTGNGSGSLTNAGLLKRTTGTGTATLSTLTVNNNSGATLQVDSGTLTVNAGTFNQNGTVTLANTSTLQRSGGFTNAGTGVIRGTGTVDVGTGNTLTNNGSINPGAASGDTTGTLSITGNYTQGATGQLNIETQGTAAGDYDVLVVSGTATLGGTLNLAEVNSFFAAGGNSFTVLTAGTRTNTFTTVNLPVDVTITPTYNATNVVLGVTSTTSRWNTDSSGDWGVAGNWSRGLPGATTDAVIDRTSADPTVTVSTGTQSAKSLTVASNDNLTISGGSLDLASASSIDPGSTLRLSGGTLSGSGAVTVTGAFNITGPSTLTGTGTLTTQGTTTINMGAANGQLFLNGKTWNNEGALTVGGDDFINLGSGGATLTNAAGGTLNLTSSNATPLNSFGGTPTINNAGILNQSAAGTHNIAFGITFNNQATGTVNVDAGTLRIDDGGTDTGLYAVDAGTTLQFAGGTRNLNAGSNITGVGTLAVSAGTVNVNNLLGIATTGAALNVSGGVLTLGAGSVAGTLAPLSLSGGTLNLNTGNAVTLASPTLSNSTIGGTDAVTVTGAFNITGPSTLTGTGTLTTQGTTTINMGAANGQLFLNGKTWNNEGALTVGGDDFINLSGATTLTNAAGGTLNLTSSNATPLNSFGGTPTINNAGILNQSAAGTHNIFGTIIFNNSGTVNVDAGSLQISNFSSNTNAGAINVASGTTLSTGGNPLTNSASGVVAGSGTINLTSATLTNNGTIRPGGAGAIGTLSIIGNYVQGPTGQFNVELQGATAGAYDVLAVSGSAALAGAFNVSFLGGYAPAAGVVHTVMTYAGGSLAVENLPAYAFPIQTGVNAGIAATAGGATAAATLNSLTLNGRDITHSLGYLTTGAPIIREASSQPTDLAEAASTATTGGDPAQDAKKKETLSVCK